MLNFISIWKNLLPYPFDNFLLIEDYHRENNFHEKFFLQISQVLLDFAKRWKTVKYYISFEWRKTMNAGIRDF